MLKILAAIAVAAALGLPTHAAARGEDLVKCISPDGTRIPATLCERYRQQEIAERKRLARFAEQDRQQQLVRDEERKQQETKSLEIRQQREKVDEEQRKEQAARQAKSEADYERYKREEAKQEKRAAENTRAKKERCGTDYGAPRIGMTIERAQDCVGNFKLVSQLNRADGVVSTYSSGRVHLHVMNGKVGAWERY